MCLEVLNLLIVWNFVQYLKSHAEKYNTLIITIYCKVVKWKCVNKKLVVNLEKKGGETSSEKKKQGNNWHVLIQAFQVFQRKKKERNSLK